MVSDFVTPDVRDGIPLPSRPFESPVTLAIRNSRVPVASNASLRPAATDEAEADTAQRIAADPSVIDAERHPLYGHGVQQRCEVTPHTEPDSLRRQRETAPTVTVPAREEGQPHGFRGARLKRDGVDAERPDSLRLARLSRWQEQR